MCGIAGVFEFRPGQATPPHVLEAMGKMIEHRGPDQGAIFQDGPIGLVARRLRIIDLSPAGSQPVPNEDGTIQLVYNGEMFNHEGLRRELQALGHRFRGRCDSEVVVHAYEAWGPRCVERFRGFFAFALWDSVRGELLLARDRIGIKPLYYAWSGDRLVFGSEIKAILEHPDVPRAMDLQSMYHYLGYEFVPGPATMFQGIRKLPPGHHRPGPRRPPRDRALLGAPVRGRARRRGDPGPPGPRDPAGLRARVDDVGRPGGRVPLGRARLDGGPGLHARGHDGAASHLHARLRRSLVQRVGVRARGCALLRDRAPRDPRPPGHSRRDRADRLAPRRADDRPLDRAPVPPVPGGAAGRHRLHVGRGGRRGLRRLRPVRRLEGRPLLPDAAARPPARGDRAPRDAAPGSGAEEGAGRRPPAVHRGSPPRSGRPPHALAVLRLGRPRRAPLPGHRAALGRPGPLRADPPRRPPAATRPGSSTARSSWTPASRCRTRC